MLLHGRWTHTLDSAIFVVFDRIPNGGEYLNVLPVVFFVVGRRHRWLVSW